MSLQECQERFMPKTEPFDRHADLYDGWFDSHRWAFLSEVEALRGFLPSFVVLAAAKERGLYPSWVGRETEWKPKPLGGQSGRELP